MLLETWRRLKTILSEQRAYRMSSARIDHNTQFREES
jgi:hypothetical protein